MTYQILIQPGAMRALSSIPDRRIQEKLRDRIEQLAHDPEKQGKPLIGELIGYRSLRAIGQRYRIIYKVEKHKIIVLVVAIGIRKEGDRADVYRLAQKLFRTGLV